MTDTTKGLIAWAVILAAGIAMGLGIGWKLWRPKAPMVETYAQAQRQQDGSLVLERKPQQLAEAAKVVPVPALPKGAKVERLAQVVVQPNPPVEPLRHSGSDASAGESTHIPADRHGELAEPMHIPTPMRVDLALVRMPDQSRRVIASSPDGQVVGGVDIPVEMADRPWVLRWAAGPSYNPADQTFGAWIERDAGPMRLGVDLHQVREPLAAGGRTSWSGMVRFGIRF